MQAIVKLMSREIVVGLHFYQPPRYAFHPDISSVSTDPQNKNWTKIIDDECYQPLAEEGVLKKASFDIYQSLLIPMEKLDPQTAEIYKNAMETNGIGEAFIHPILPDLSNIDKEIVISAGVLRFQEITGSRPKYFWPPETAIDTDTLEVLANNGYEGFICAPEQILQSDDRSSDNRPTRIDLPSGRQIIALPFDRPISSKLAFDPKKNADYFTHNFITPRTHNLDKKQIAIAWTDAETFGHHWPQADKFLTYLLENSLPSVGLYPVSINSLRINANKIPRGKIVERSAWSCPHGNLIRWGGQCACGWDGDTRWKEPFYKSMKFLNDSVSEILRDEIGGSYPELVAYNFYENYAGENAGRSPIDALISAKISSLVARISCATFFAHPEVSGKINLLYSYQTLMYLGGAGLGKKVLELSTEFYDKLSQVEYPGSMQNALSVLDQMLQGK